MRIGISRRNRNQRTVVTAAYSLFPKSLNFSHRGVHCIISLTIVAIGTSLPELASFVIAARKGEQYIALGNVLGLNK